MNFKPTKLKVVLSILISIMIGFVILLIQPDYCISALRGTYRCSISPSRKFLELFETLNGILLLISDFVVVYIILSLLHKKENKNRKLTKKKK